MKKMCGRCKNKLDVSNFNKKSTKKDGSIVYQPYCRDCNKVYSRGYYNRNSEKHKKSVAITRSRIVENGKQWMIEYLMNHPCVDCGNSDIRVLQFDHLRDKKHNISSMIGRSINSIQLEIAKCEVRCANCHAIKTCERRNSYKLRGKNY